MARHVMQLRLEEGLIDAVRERAEKQGWSANEWINQAVKYALLRGEREMTKITKVTL